MKISKTKWDILATKACPNIEKLEEEEELNLENLTEKILTLG